ncbi:MAG: hypothetical protein U0946_00795 [Patescibacteria group bacterium]|nr:hypothetical protein [Patescibacteria group bacterium]
MPPNSLPTEIQDFFKAPAAPPGLAEYEANPALSPLILFFSNIYRLAIFGIFIYAIINFFISAIQYIGSAGNPETLKQASGRIWISFLGLIIVAVALLLAAVIGIVFFHDARFLLNPAIPDPAGYDINIKL